MQCRWSMRSNVSHVVLFQLCYYETDRSISSAAHRSSRNQPAFTHSFYQPPTAHPPGWPTNTTSPNQRGSGFWGLFIPGEREGLAYYGSPRHNMKLGPHYRGTAVIRRILIFYNLNICMLNRLLLRLFCLTAIFNQTSPFFIFYVKRALGL